MANYENSLGVKALTLDDINKQYGINASREYAQQQAQNQLNQQLGALNQQRKQYQTNAYEQSRETDLNYFDQFNQQRYNSAGRGLTGGMQQMGQQSLNLGRNSDLSKIYTQLTGMLSDADNRENQYKTESTRYADNLYQTNLGKAQDLISSDFQRRLSIAQEEYNRRQEEERIRRELERQEYERRIQEEAIARQKAQQEWENQFAREQFDFEKQMSNANLVARKSSGGSSGGSKKSSGSGGSGGGSIDTKAILDSAYSEFQSALKDGWKSAKAWLDANGADVKSLDSNMYNKMMNEYNAQKPTTKAKNWADDVVKTTKDFNKTYNKYAGVSAKSVAKKAVSSAVKANNASKAKLKQTQQKRVSAVTNWFKKLFK